MTDERLPAPLVLERFLPAAMEDEVQRVIMGHAFPWFYYPNTNTTDEATQADDSPQLVHGFIQNHKSFSEWGSVAHALTQRLGLPDDVIIRAKANLVGRARAPLTHPAHVDDDQRHWVFIYYVNTADGDTVLFDEADIAHRITPKKGRGVLFDGRWRHASSSPVEAPFRCVFNYNLTIDAPVSDLGRFAVTD